MKKELLVEIGCCVFAIICRRRRPLARHPSTKPGKTATAFDFFDSRRIFPRACGVAFSDGKDCFYFQSSKLIEALTDAEQAFAHFGVNGGGQD